MAEDIQVGDVVLLNSGGPDMTVDEIGKLASMSSDGPLSAWCSWFDSRGERQTHTFPLTSLIKKKKE